MTDSDEGCGTGCLLLLGVVVVTLVIFADLLWLQNTYQNQRECHVFGSANGCASPDRWWWVALGVSLAVWGAVAVAGYRWWRNASRSAGW